MDSWIRKYTQLHDILQNLAIWDANGADLLPENGFLQWREYCTAIKERNNQIFFIGNGASSSMASHFATDVVKNAGIRARVFTDSSLLTAVGNDLGFEDVYAEPLRWNANRGDMVIAISSSGNSPNIVKAIQIGKQLELSVVTLSSMSPDNTIRTVGDLNFYVAAETYGLAESSHAVILHHWMDLLSENHG